MITIDCPLCACEATTDDTLSTLTCDGCDVAVDVAPDSNRALEIAA
jgi:hypothetical protein